MLTPKLLIETFDSNSTRDLTETFEEQGKSSDIEQQPPFCVRKISNIQPRNRGRGTKPTKTSYNFDKV